MSAQQKKLFALLCEYTTNTVVDFVSISYKKFGLDVTASGEFVSRMLPFINEYFNQCAIWVYSREDKYINEKFDEMIAVIKYDPIDILDYVVLMSMAALNDIDIKDVVTKDYELTIAAVRAHVQSLVKRVDKSHELTGCNHVHMRSDEPKYDLVMQKYIDYKGESVKLNTL